LASTTDQLHTINGRYDKPFLPCNVRVNSGLAVSNIALTTALTISWSHRSKTDNKMSVYNTDLLNLDGGVTYTLRLYDENNTLRRTVTGITGKTYEWTTEETDSGLTGRLNNSVRFELEAEQGGTVSEFIFDRTVTRS